MNKKSNPFTDWLFSLKLTVILLFLTGFVTGAATFVENDFGRPAAQEVIYRSFWFEGILVLLTVNLIGAVIRFRMWKKEKIFIFMFHISFILMLVGAGLTRYFGFEGIMHIREGRSSSEMYSEFPYFQIRASEEGGKDSLYQRRLVITDLTPASFRDSFTLNGKAVSLETTASWTHAGTQVTESLSGGKAFLSMRVLGPEGRPDDIMLEEGTSAAAGGISLNFSGDGNSADFSFRKKEGKIEFLTAAPVNWLRMSDKAEGALTPGVWHPLEQGKLFRKGEAALVARAIVLNGERKAMQSETKTGLSGLAVRLTYNGESAEVSAAGSSGMFGEESRVKIGGADFTVSFGSRPVKLPFSVKLDRFVMQRYPGSSSPSSYESYVTVIDKANSVEMPYHIYMNHILVYQGYRFYQSSYDQDEKGTILQVAKDPGMWPTYAGYALMTIGFLLAPFTRAGRFRRLAKMIDRDRLQTVLLILSVGAAVTGFLPGSGSGLFAQEIRPPSAASSYSEAHLKSFRSLRVQDIQGRIKPADTMAMDVLNKVSRRSDLAGLSWNHVFLGMLTDQGAWERTPMIRIGQPGVNVILGISQNQKYAAFSDFFVNSGSGSGYKIYEAVEKAQRTKESARSKLDKEIIKVDERTNISYMVYRGDIMRIFPVPEHPGDKWISASEARKYMDEETAVQVEEKWSGYLAAVKAAARSGDWKEADALLQWIHDFQKKHGADVYPSDAKTNAEILFNNLNTFDRLTAVYLLTGFALLAMVFVRVAREDISFKIPMLILHIITAAAFAAHTAALGLRWYVSGHSPWSNGYESLIFIAWATVLAGFLFSRQSLFSLAATSVVSGLWLFVAHLSWMDPQITTLVPVLNSYWLTLHVSVISASYGFLALAALLSFIVLVFFIFRSKARVRIDRSVTEMVRISEMSMMIGLAMLSVGNILGAIWANESWGRYWSWDPKETWTFVSMVIYAAVLHFRFIPALNSNYAYAVGGLLSFFAILMTYFGVNYYLTGLHSYAAGDPVPIPWFLYAAVAVIGLIIWMSARKRDSRMPFRSSADSL